MAREIIKEAATVEEARALIAAELNTTEDKFTFEVVQEAGKKVLGLFGGSNAVVKGTLNGSAADIAKEYLEKVLAAMGVTEFTCTVKEENNGCVITLDGEHLGFIIGRRGDTLDALQYLTSLVANRVDNAYYRVTLDIGNYREKRGQALVALAQRLAAKTLRTGRRSSLEPMNPYERRIIHTSVQKVEGATSYSVGSEPNRHVVITASEDNPVKSRSNRSRQRNNQERPARGERRADALPERPVREVRKFVSRSNPVNIAEDYAPPERTQSETEKTATLYGRIDL